MENMNSKPYDWVVALSESPQNTFGDFYQQGLTPDNASLLSKDQYESTDYVRKRFVDGNGKFDKGSFDNFYNTAVKLYNEYEKERFN